ncbi:MAG: hypothetical protein Q9173_006562 [Seirophora scorigena]
MTERKKEGRRGGGLRERVAAMTLHNVFTVCFSGTTGRGEETTAGRFLVEETVPPGHRIGFRRSVLETLNHIRTMAFMPKIILNLLHRAQLPPPAIKGNIFSFLFAGHEANANTLTLALFLLALHPSVQQSLQDTIDTRLAGYSGAAAGKLDYATHYPLFRDSIVTAIINETLRLFTILPFLPKTTPAAPASVVVKGNKHVLPPDTLVLINTSAIHRHPMYWPAAPPSAGSRHGCAPYPAWSFNPGHWLGGGGEGGDSDAFLRPQPGSFVPFSDGARGCLGRQFAMVELCAQLVGIFAEWRVELVVAEEEGSGWEGGRARAERILSEKVVFDMTLRPGEMVPIRFVKREMTGAGSGSSVRGGDSSGSEVLKGREGRPTG